MQVGKQCQAGYSGVFKPMLWVFGGCGLAPLAFLTPSQVDGVSGLCQLSFLLVRDIIGEAYNDVVIAYPKVWLLVITSPYVILCFIEQWRLQTLIILVKPNYFSIVLEIHVSERKKLNPHFLGLTTIVENEN